MNIVQILIKVPHVNSEVLVQKILKTLLSFIICERGTSNGDIILVL